MKRRSQRVLWSPASYSIDELIGGEIGVEIERQQATSDSINAVSDRCRVLVDRSALQAGVGDHGITAHRSRAHDERDVLQWRAAELPEEFR